MDISALIHQMVILFAVIAVAYLATKTGLLPSGTNKVLSDLIVNITCPATILYSIATSSRSLSNTDVLLILVLAVVIHAGMIGIAALATRLMGIPRDNRGVYHALMVMANVSFLGFPVIRSLFGNDGVFVASIYNIIFSLISFTYGTSQLASLPEDKKISMKMFCTPVIISSILGLVLYILNFPFPTIAVDILKALDSITASGAMIVIGCALAAAPLKEILKNVRVYISVAIRLVLIPVIAWFLLGLFMEDGMLYGVLVTLTALPSATTVSLLASKYDGDTATASAGLSISTIFSLITLPVLLQILF